MLKNIISPVQAWFLSQGRCVGCGTLLSKGQTDNPTQLLIQVTCTKCGRIFIYNKETKKYIRAPNI